MKFIDKQGRLFGKINIVDFFIIILLLIIIPGFFYIYKVLAVQPSWVPSHYVTVEAVTFTAPEVAELIKPGQTATGKYFGKTVGKIIKVIKKDEKYAERIKSTVKKTHGEYEYRIPVFLEMKLLSTLSAEGEPFYYQRKELHATLDDSYLFTTSDYKIYLYILKVKDKPSFEELARSR